MICFDLINGTKSHGFSGHERPIVCQPFFVSSTALGMMVLVGWTGGWMVHHLDPDGNSSIYIYLFIILSFLVDKEIRKSPKSSQVPSLSRLSSLKQTRSNSSQRGGNRIRLCELVFQGRTIIFDIRRFSLMHQCSPLSGGRYHTGPVVCLSSPQSYKVISLDATNKGSPFSGSL